MSQYTGADLQDKLIARVWGGATRKQDQEAYLAYLRETGLDAYRRTPGNRGVLALSRIHQENAEFLLLSLWDSRKAIQAFAGSDIDRAVFYPRDDELLIARELDVRHYDLLFHRGLPTP